MIGVQPMVKVVLVLILVAGVAVRTAEAQALGYGIAGPAGFSGFFGSSASGLHAAGGAEVLVGGRAGVAAELGVLANATSALLVFSGNGVFHALRATTERGPSPFVTGGYTYMRSGEGSFNAWNVGAGLDIWLSDHVGVRLEFRDHVRPDRRGAVQYWTFRAGVSFR
jgi:hypothetical protein